METLYLPTLHSFAMNNVFTGSQGAFRFRVKPQVVMATAKEVDFQQSTILAQFWHGPFCFEKSVVEGENIFPMTEEGRLKLFNWLESNI